MLTIELAELRGGLFSASIELVLVQPDGRLGRLPVEFVDLGFGLVGFGVQVGRVESGLDLGLDTFGRLVDLGLKFLLETIGVR